MRIASVILLIVMAAPLCALGPDNVLILANSKAAGSVEIAEYYAKLRGISPERILKISASEQEEIKREEFTKEIWEPTRAAVLADEKICVIVPTRGVPLKVKGTTERPAASGFEGRDDASVDSELMMVRVDELKVDAALENPLFDSKERIAPASGLVVVARLDGPTAEIARGMAEKALLAETLGAHGRSFLDTGMGNLTGAAYEERDALMRRVGDSWRKAGVVFDHDSDADVVDLSTRDETLHYYGWYATTQQPAGRVQFRTGGICVHLHSFSAATIRNAGRNWVGPLLSWGATASYGTVYEPFTVGYPFEHIFWDRLCQGFTFGEAGLIATRTLSWQAVFCGDPLYSPHGPDRAELNARYLAAVLHVLAPEPDAEAPDVQGLPLLGSLVDVLKTRHERIEQLLASDAGAALAEFNELRFLVRGMGLGNWIGSIAGPFQRDLEQRFDDMKKRIKDDATDTADFEDALRDWAGLPIHDDLEKFRTGLVRTQERAAANLLRTAQGHRRSKRWLRAWQAASEAAAYAFAPEPAAEAKLILDEIKDDADVLREIKTESDRALKPLVERAQREYERGRAERAWRTLGRSWMWYPDCEQRKEAEALAGKIRADLEKEE